MLFNSLVFIFLFLPVSVIVYFYLTQKRLILGSKLWLVATSLFFYSYWNINYLPIILISMSFNFFIGSAITKNEIKTRINKKAFLIFGILANIMMLGYYKYADFFIDNFNIITQNNYELLHILLPLAISFFTFQQIAYLVDSYHGMTKEYDFLTYALFVTFFPQLIAGPIVHHKELIPQFAKTSNLARNYKNIASGIFIFVIGLFKKVVIADTLAQVATKGFDLSTTLNMAEAWITSLAYTMQIYYDFSGYCDMAIGIGLMFNIKLPINFNSPYKATNIQDFWKRWHMTLSRFLRDYIYIPLGGNRKGVMREYLNLFAVFVIGGFWHGAAWGFIVWGVLHGTATVIHKLWKITSWHINKYLAWFITFNFVNITWVFFRAKNFDDAKKVLSAMFDLNSLMALESYRTKIMLAGLDVRSNMLNLLLLAIFIATLLPNSLHLLERFNVKNKTLSYVYGVSLGTILLILTAKIIIVPYTEFIYFNF